MYGTVKVPFVLHYFRLLVQKLYVSNCYLRIYTRGLFYLILSYLSNLVMHEMFRMGYNSFISVHLN